jgi:hypothetical protein
MLATTRATSSCGFRLSSLDLWRSGGSSARRRAHYHIHLKLSYKKFARCPCLPTLETTRSTRWLTFLKFRWVTRSIHNNSTTSYGSLDKLFRTISSVFGLFNGLANFQLTIPGKFHRLWQFVLHHTACGVAQFLNDLVIDSPHLGRVRNATTPADNPCCSTLTPLCSWPGRGSDLFWGVSGKSNLFFSIPNGHEFE